MFLDRLLSRVRRLAPQRYTLDFRDGPFVHNLSRIRRLTARFYLDGALEYEVTLGHRRWGKAYKRNCAPWQVEVCDEWNELIESHPLDLHGKRVCIEIDSRSLGDTLAWVPQIARFAAVNLSAEVYCSHFWPDTGFEKAYPEIRFSAPNTPVDDCYATYKIGYFLGDDMLHSHRVDPRGIPLPQIAADVLNIPYEERRPRLHVENQKRTIAEPYICFAMESTAGCKLWNHPGGWQDIVDYFNARGYRAVLIQKQIAGLERIINKSGDLPVQDRMTDIMHCKLFIGLASGLSWLAWALNKPVVMISGFSEPFTEFRSDCYRVINKDVCTGCWNDATFQFDRSDWNWCPRHGGTHRQWECSKEITTDMVIEQIERALGSG